MRLLVFATQETGAVVLCSYLFLLVAIATQQNGAVVFVQLLVYATRQAGARNKVF